ncbi:uncharacterized protein B0J16DRAFT_69392 [Fusarium flagelliforme]|uniref:uncharacterized protein n=1 Tax=Fusarium flagelliforme TaxID=2675880 RepID=UPI001E8E2306|nr:uncharacterized protein B0J16DRAFT_69392 [Fusarium flagelliforme]KAH7193021.1 hypothetical protein B0J16DRAFT_69392 [Fusarium flagelliforme]
MPSSTFLGTSFPILLTVFLVPKLPSYDLSVSDKVHNLQIPIKQQPLSAVTIAVSLFCSPKPAFATSFTRCFFITLQARKGKPSSYCSAALAARLVRLRAHCVLRQSQRFFINHCRLSNRLLSRTSSQS